MHRVLYLRTCQHLCLRHYHHPLHHVYQHQFLLVSQRDSPHLSRRVVRALNLAGCHLVNPQCCLRPNRALIRALSLHLSRRCSPLLSQQENRLVFSFIMICAVVSQFAPLSLSTFLLFVTLDVFRLSKHSTFEQSHRSTIGCTFYATLGSALIQPHHAALQSAIW